MRGSLQLGLDELSHPGIIPAHAGLTLQIGSIRRIGGDHPRACGAHSICTRFLLGLEGSSPRMRGSLVEHPEGLVLFGIIPAHAGLTPLFFVTPAGGRDHPRACGAHIVRLLPWPVSRGSSPRMRGSLKFKTIPIFEKGIIPAHAGLTIHQ